MDSAGRGRRGAADRARSRRARAARPSPVLVSACLLGFPTRYDGRAKTDRTLLGRIERGEILPIPVCPEVLGGLPVPRPAARIVGGTAIQVLAGHATVRDDTGRDVTHAFVRGARLVVAIARAAGCATAILVPGSPSCAPPARGVAAAALRLAGVATRAGRGGGGDRKRGRRADRAILGVGRQPGAER